MARTGDMNQYSQTWFETFLDTVPAEQTAAEVAFVSRQMPRPHYTTMLDICCGPGRHAGPLSARGYHVIGVDTNATALARAVRTTPKNPRYLRMDMRDVDALRTKFDGALIMWQSFGAFDPAGNARQLSTMAASLRLGGRLLLDLFHREFFEAHQGSGPQRRASWVTETKIMSGKRLTVTLDYGTGTTDTLGWELFTPAELADLARACGLQMVLACRDFNEQVEASAEGPRMQVVLERS